MIYKIDMIFIPILFILSIMSNLTFEAVRVWVTGAAHVRVSRISSIDNVTAAMLVSAQP